MCSFDFAKVLALIVLIDSGYIHRFLNGNVVIEHKSHGNCCRFGCSCHLEHREDHVVVKRQKQRPQFLDGRVLGLYLYVVVNLQIDAVRLLQDVKYLLGMLLLGPRQA